MKLNGKQLIQIVGVIISVAMVSSAQLTELLGPGVAKTIVTVAGLANMILQGITVTLTTQTAQINDVLSMPGIQHVEVNANANATLAAIAVNPTVNKIAPTADDREKVEQIATKS